jgi:hypothetical protein
MGLLKKLFGGENPAEAAHDAELGAFLHHGSLPPGPPAAGDGHTDVSVPARLSGDTASVTDEIVAAAFDAEVVGHEVVLDDGAVFAVDFGLRGDDNATVSVYICNHTGMPGMAVDDESTWRDTGVARELPGLGDSAFVNDEGTLFARLGDRYTIQILTPRPGPTDEDIGHCRTLARSILDRLDSGASPASPEASSGASPASPEASSGASPASPEPS